MSSTERLESHVRGSGSAIHFFPITKCILFLPFLCKLDAAIWWNMRVVSFTKMNKEAVVLDNVQSFSKHHFSHSLALVLTELDVVISIGFDTYLIYVTPARLCPIKALFDSEIFLYNLFIKIISLVNLIILGLHWLLICCLFPCIAKGIYLANLHKAPSPLHPLHLVSSLPFLLIDKFSSSLSRNWMWIFPHPYTNLLQLEVYLTLFIVEAWCFFSLVCLLDMLIVYLLDVWYCFLHCQLMLLVGLFWTPLCGMHKLWQLFCQISGFALLQLYMFKAYSSI